MLSGVKDNVDTMSIESVPRHGSSIPSMWEESVDTGMLIHYYPHSPSLKFVNLSCVSLC